LLVAAFFMNLGVDIGYFLGFVGYAAYGFGGKVNIIATAMGILSAFYMIGSLLGGILIDRIGPRHATFFSSIAMVGVCFAVQLMAGHLMVFLIMTALYGLVGALLQSSFAAFAPYLSRERDGVRRINSYMTTCMFSATIFGGLLGVLITTTFTHLSLFWMVAFVVAISGVLVLSVHEKYSPHEADGEPGVTGEQDAVKTSHPLRGALEGWKLIRGSSALRFYLLIAIAMWFCFGAFDALESLYYKDILLVPVSWMGWINSIAGVGFAIGAFSLSRIPSKFISAFLLVVLLAFEGATSVLYVSTTSRYWSAFGIFLLAITYGIADPLMRTLVQADSPLSVVGRVMGTVDMIRKGFTFVPLLIAPLLYRLWGVQPVLIGASLTTIVMALSLYPASRRLDEAVETAGTRHLEQADAR
ncbi:MAG: MFS transporter, partial [Actinomycetia bacterium]|nr:MFS transporter [Actinomycetes bacterium]